MPSNTLEQQSDGSFRMTASPYVIVHRYHVHPSAENQLREILLPSVREALCSSGCIDYKILHTSRRPEWIVLSSWENEKACHRYVKSSPLSRQLAELQHSGLLEVETLMNDTFELVE